MAWGSTHSSFFLVFFYLNVNFEEYCQLLVARVHVDDFVDDVLYSDREHGLGVWLDSRAPITVKGEHLTS